MKYISTGIRKNLIVVSKLGIFKDTPLGKFSYKIITFHVKEV
jgi:hypothetical protein